MTLSGRVAISGASGLLGRALSERLTDAGVKVESIRRDASGGFGNLAEGTFRGVDAVVHLAGEPIMGRWNAAKKQRIRDSRVEGTRQVAEAVVRDEVPVFLSGSAIGIYGDAADTMLDESSDAGSDFLAEVGAAWEAAAQPAVDGKARVVFLRTGIVMTPRGGALKAMLLPFRMGVGGRVGSGKQYWSWISLEDWLRATVFALQDDRVCGPINLTAPNPATNATFTKALGKSLRRPTILPVPAFVLRLLFGEVADFALLGSQRVLPRRLTDLGFTFEDPEIQPALSGMLT